jgi:hypothetical protein
MQYMTKCTYMAMASFYNLSHEQIGTATYFEMVRSLVLFKLSRKYSKVVIKVWCQKSETLLILHLDLQNMT